MPRLIPAQHLSNFCSYLDTRRHPIRLAGWLMLEAGLRISEALSLAWCDLVWLNEPKSILELTASATKNHRRRELPISRPLADVIKITWHYANKATATNPASYALSKTPNGLPISTRTLQRAINSAGKKSIGIPITPHTLRHTFATRLLRVSNVRTVQQALGHRRIATTQVYTHPDINDLTEAIQRIHLQ